MWPNPQETADLVTFTEEILNGKLHSCAGVVKVITWNKRYVTKFYLELSAWH